MDIDECERIENICMNGLCENTNGIFRCICDQGYTLDENGSNCTDINECDDPQQSCQYGTCINSDGGFICECPDGFDKLPSGNNFSLIFSVKLQNLFEIIGFFFFLQETDVLITEKDHAIQT